MITCVWLGSFAMFYVGLTAARCWHALRHAEALERGGDRPATTIIQPILSGDPNLEAMLSANLAQHPEANFLWMVDASDAEGCRIAEKLAAANVMVVKGPDPTNGENPKMAKLIAALPLVRTARLVVLDDDTFLPASLPTGALVTGLPLFPRPRSVFECLIAGFINGNSVLTYLPAARLGLQRTINGMAYAVDTAQLRNMGGFAAAGHAVTDDYAIAKLYARHGVAPLQSATFLHVHITVGNAVACAGIMRRWMLFASHYLRENAGVATLFWVGLPSVLPLLGLLLFAWEGLGSFWVLLLAGKAIANRLVVRRLAGLGFVPLDLVFEMLSDLLLPFWSLLTLFRPHHLQWRSRKIRLEGESIRYE